MQVESMQGQSIGLRCKILLDELSRAMRQSQLWSEQGPSLDALASSIPFACDTMAFEQWLQFIFIPKMHLLIEQQQPLPGNIAVLPMAEEVYKSATGLDEVLIALARIDRLLGEPLA
jgi:uncharacterized protein YqcC (DUF446 family)